MLPDWDKISFKASTAAPWAHLIPCRSENERQLVESFLRYNSIERITAVQVHYILY